MARAKIDYADTEFRLAVSALASCRFTEAQIARVLGISLAELKEHFALELMDGKQMACAHLLRAAYAIALAGNVSMIQFLLRTHHGFTDRVTVDLNTLVSMSDDDLAKLLDRLTPSGTGTAALPYGSLADGVSE